MLGIQTLLADRALLLRIDFVILDFCSIFQPTPDDLGVLNFGLGVHFVLVIDHLHFLLQVL